MGYDAVTPRSIRYFTFLRDPVDRYLSHFEYQVDRMHAPWTLDTFLSESRFSNLMTTRIAGAPDVGRAKTLLGEKFAFVGLTERFDESLILMRQALRLGHFDARYERKNASPRHQPPRREQAYREDPGVLRKVASQNRLDLELYAFAQDTLYPEYERRYGEGLRVDVARLRADMAHFHFNVRRRYMWALYRKVVYQPLELMARRRYH